MNVSHKTANLLNQTARSDGVVRSCSERVERKIMFLEKRRPRKRGVGNGAVLVGERKG